MLSSVNSVRPAGEKIESPKNRTAVSGNQPMSVFYLVFRQLSFLILVDLTRSTHETHKTPDKGCCRKDCLRSSWWGLGVAAVSRWSLICGGKVLFWGCVQSWAPGCPRPAPPAVFLLHFDTQSSHLPCLCMQKKNESTES